MGALAEIFFEALLSKRFKVNLCCSAGRVRMRTCCLLNNFRCIFPYFFRTGTAEWMYILLAFYSVAGAKPAQLLPAVLGEIFDDSARQDGCTARVFKYVPISFPCVPPGVSSSNRIHSASVHAALSSGSVISVLKAMAAMRADGFGPNLSLYNKVRHVEGSKALGIAKPTARKQSEGMWSKY